MKNICNYKQNFLSKFLNFQKLNLIFQDIDDYNKLIGAQQIYLRIVMKRITNHNETNDTKEVTYQVHQFFGE